MRRGEVGATRIGPRPRRAIPRSGELELLVPFFFPVAGIVVIAVALPEAWLVLGEQLDPSQPLCALPEVPARDDEPQRPAVLGLEGLAVGLVGDQCLLV